MTGVEIKPVRDKYIPELVSNLSDIARADIEDFGRLEAKLADEIKGSIFTQVGLWRGQVGCLWGVRKANLLDRYGYLWAMTTNLVEEHPFIFARQSKMVIDQMMEEYDCLHGVVRPELKRSIRWLKFLGFEILPLQNLEGTNYYPFLRRG
jgi:hypothetical protein